MKSAQISQYSDKPEQMQIVDVPKPEPGPGEVRVRMLMSPVNPSDLNFLHGTYRKALERVIWNHGATDSETVFNDPGRTAPCPEPPFALGGEGVGVVDATGSGFLAGRLKGKRVAIAAGPPNGAWQEYTVVNAKRAVPLPTQISDEQGAMFFVNPVTAYVMTRKVLNVPKGEWLLVTAAGSALGKSVVRLGQVYGFRTLCVARSNANTEELLKLGATAVVETQSQDLLTQVHRLTDGKGVSFAIDCVGGELTGKLVQCLSLDGRLVLYGTLSPDPLVMPVRDLMMPAAHISGFLLPNWMAQQSVLTVLGVLRAVKKLTLQGLFDAPVTQRFELDDVVGAVNAALQRGRTGKVMLQIGSRNVNE